MQLRVIDLPLVHCPKPVSCRDCVLDSIRSGALLGVLTLSTKPLLSKTRPGGKSAILSNLRHGTEKSPTLPTLASSTYRCKASSGVGWDKGSSMERLYDSVRVCRSHDTDDQPIMISAKESRRVARIKQVACCTVCTVIARKTVQFPHFRPEVTWTLSGSRYRYRV